MLALVHGLALGCPAPVQHCLLVATGAQAMLCRAHCSQGYSERKNEFVMRPHRPPPIVALHKFMFPPMYLRIPSDACFLVNIYFKRKLLVPCYPGKVVGPIDQSVRWTQLTGFCSVEHR